MSRAGEAGERRAAPAAGGGVPRFATCAGNPRTVAFAERVAGPCASAAAPPEPRTTPLGERVAGLRRERGLAREELAARAGLAVARLADLESGALERLGREELLRVVAALEVRDFYDRLQLRQLNTAPLRFKAFKVGLIATGGHALARMFSAYRTGWEFGEVPLTRAIARWRAGAIGTAELRRLLRRRDCRGAFELDVSAVTHHCAALLAEEFPFARFVLTLRDGLAWADGVLDWLLTVANEHVRAHAALLVGLDDLDDLAAGRLEARLPRVAEGLLRFWARENARLLRELPRERTLVVETERISESGAEIARFLGIPPETLSRERALGYTRYPPRRLIRSLPDDVIGDIRARCEAAAATA